MNLELDKRLYKRISEYCSVNNLNIEEYISEIIEKQFNLDCYGDINDIFNKKDMKHINNYSINLPYTEDIQEVEIKQQRKKRIIDSK